MKPLKNQNQENNEIAHVIKTVVPILFFTVTVIIVCLITVSYVYGIPVSMVIEQFFKTLISVLMFNGSK